MRTSDDFLFKQKKDFGSLQSYALQYGLYVGGLAVVRALTLFRDAVTWSTSAVFGLYWSGKSQQIPPITDPLLLYSLVDLARMIREQEVTSETVITAYIQRIREVNPILNAVVDERFDVAVEEAREADRRITEAGGSTDELERELPLLGVPFTIKENFQVKGLRHTVGLLERRNCIGTENAEAVKQMVNAGAILLGVTNLSELCTWWESRNNVYGQTNNPYDTTRCAGGSSGGEGSIVSACGSVIGIGSDIGGSIRMPAFFNGIFGHKPSSGLTLNGGQLPVAEGDLQCYLTTGPLCRYATDLRPVLRILSAPNHGRFKYDTQVDLSKLRLFYMVDDGGFPLVSGVSEELKQCQKKVVDHFQRVHGVKAQQVCLPEMTRSLEIWAGKMCGCGAPTFCEEMAQRKYKVNIYVELVKFVLGLSSHTLPAILLGLLEKVDVGRTKGDFIEISKTARKLKADFQRMLGDDGIFLYPSFPVVAPYHYQALLIPFNFTYTAIFNIMGLPVTQCPLGLNEKRIPLGIQVAANVDNDHLTLAVAEELERTFGGWVPPYHVS